MKDTLNPIHALATLALETLKLLTERSLTRAGPACPSLVKVGDGLGNDTEMLVLLVVSFVGLNSVDNNLKASGFGL